MQQTHYRGLSTIKLAIEKWFFSARPTKRFVLSGVFFWVREKFWHFQRSCSSFLNRKRPSITVNETTSVKTLTKHYPAFADFLENTYRITLAESDLRLSLRHFTKKQNLPPAQILFMKFSLNQRSKVRRLRPPEFRNWLKETPGAVLFDAREQWEREWASIEGGKPMIQDTLKEAANWPKSTPIAVYCHYGVRSMDAAAYFSDKGFGNVCVLEGGIDAWSSQVDPSLKRYPGHPC